MRGIALVSILLLNHVFAIELNGFQGPMVGKAMNGYALGSVFYPTITFCAQVCDSSVSCRAFSWGFRGEAVWYATDSTGQSIPVGLCVFHSVNSSGAALDSLPDYDFYEELASGPTPDPSNALQITGYLGPFNGTSTSGINDITGVGGIEVSTAVDCANLCSADSDCRSFDFASRGFVMGDCHLSRVNREEAGPAYTVWPLYDYYEKLLPTIPEYVADNTGEFSILSAALSASNLLSEISGPGPFTLFAPSDQAMRAAGINSLSDLQANSDWIQILEFHVALGRFESSTLSSGDQLLTVHGDKVRITGTSDAILIDDVGVNTANIPCSNGVIHIIDGLLSPPAAGADETIVEKLNTRGFTLLEQALLSSGVATELANTGEPWTMFAPTDTAMEAFYLTEGLSREEFLASSQLTSILRSHIAMGLVRTANADSGVHSVTMLEGDPLLIQRAPGGQYLAQRGNAVAAMGPFDLYASDGLLHAVDRVISDPDRADLGGRQSESTGDSGDDDEGGARVLRLILPIILILCLCTIGGLLCVLLRRRRNQGMAIPETTVQQDGVTVVMGKPVVPAGEEAAAASSNGKGGESDAKASGSGSAKEV
mmetsp:Transcript_43520/g.100168  ORF Transcript_43520/g.100168 Transcript_43520/m.100168 type:complete len:598 (+) Transcript_43520:79-1872(+)